MRESIKAIVIMILCLIGCSDYQEEPVTYIEPLDTLILDTTHICGIGMMKIVESCPYIELDTIRYNILPGFHYNTMVKEMEWSATKLGLEIDRVIIQDSINPQIEVYSTFIDSVGQTLAQASLPNCARFMGVIEIDQDDIKHSKYDLTSTVFHELNHAVGALHVDEPLAMLYPKTSGEQTRYFHEADLKELARLDYSKKKFVHEETVYLSSTIIRCK